MGTSMVTLSVQIHTKIVTCKTSLKARTTDEKLRIKKIWRN